MYKGESVKNLRGVEQYIKQDLGENINCEREEERKGEEE